MFLALGTSEQRRAERSRDPLVLMFLKDREAKHPQESILRRAPPSLHSRRAKPIWLDGLRNTGFSR